MRNLDPYNPAAYAAKLKVGDECVFGYIDNVSGEFFLPTYQAPRKFTVSRILKEHVALVHGAECKKVSLTSGRALNDGRVPGDWSSDLVKKYEARVADEARKAAPCNWWNKLSCAQREAIFKKHSKKTPA